VSNKASTTWAYQNVLSLLTTASTLAIYVQPGVSLPDWLNRGLLKCRSVLKTEAVA